MAKITFDQHWWPTTVDAGDGKFHPAIESVAGVFNTGQTFAIPKKRRTSVRHWR